MKRLFVAGLCVLLAGLCACGQAAPVPTTAFMITTTFGPEPTTPAPAVIDPREIAPYADALKEYCGRPGVVDTLHWQWFYALYDIDGNGIKELLLGTEYSGIVTIYTILDGVVARQGFASSRYVSQEPPLLFENGTIRTGGSGEGDVKYDYYRFAAGELKYQAGLSRYSEYNYDNCFRYDPDSQEETPIANDEYERVQEEFEGDGQVVWLDKKPLANYVS